MEIKRELLDVLAALRGGHLARRGLLELLPEQRAALEQQRARPSEASESAKRASPALPLGED